MFFENPPEGKVLSFPLKKMKRSIEKQDWQLGRVCVNKNEYRERERDHPRSKRQLFRCHRRRRFCLSAAGAVRDLRAV